MKPIPIALTASRNAMSEQSPMPPLPAACATNSSHWVVRLHPKVPRFIPAGCCHPDRNGIRAETRFPRPVPRGVQSTIGLKSAPTSVSLRIPCAPKSCRDIVTTRQAAIPKIRDPAADFRFTVCSLLPVAEPLRATLCRFHLRSAPPMHPKVYWAVRFPDTEVSDRGACASPEGDILRWSCLRRGDQFCSDQTQFDPAVRQLAASAIARGQCRCRPKPVRARHRGVERAPEGALHPEPLLASQLRCVRFFQRSSKAEALLSRRFPVPRAS